MWQADPRLRQCPPGIADRPQGLGASPGSTAIELCDAQKAAKPQPTHLQNGWIGQVGCLRGCHSEEKDKWGSEQHRCEEEKSPSKPPGDYSLCGFLATPGVFLSFWTQHTDCPLGELVLPHSAPVCFHGAHPSPRLQVDRYPISTHSQASGTGSGLNVGQ